jgi:hypothetical protein
VPKANVIVDEVKAITRPRGASAARSVLAVRFAGGATAQLPAHDPRGATWAEVLESLRASGEQAYVEVDAASGQITSLLLPRPFNVDAIRELTPDGDLEIDLSISHARHYLRRSHPDFASLYDILRRSQREGHAVLVTESLEGDAIVDVRPRGPAPNRPKRGRQ